MYLVVGGEMFSDKTPRFNTNIFIRYFSINRILLLAIGLWPYQRSRLAQFQIILFLSILTSFIIFQLTTFLTTEISLNLIINVLSCVLCFTCILINYSWFWSNLQYVKSILEQLQYICSDIKDENEIAIINKYGTNAKRLTISFILFSICAIFLAISQPILSRILNVFISINGSQSLSAMQIETEYFVDQEKYSYLILMHMDAAICIAIMATASTGLTIIVSLKYACGLFRIASYRIEEALTINMLKNIGLENYVVIYKKIIFAIDIHRKAMQLVLQIFNISFEILAFFLIAIAVICMSLNLFGVASFENDVEKLLTPLIRVFIIIICMFLGNYAGQEIIDHNNHIFFVAYNTHWYKTPLYIQKIIFILLQRGNKAFNLSVGGLFVSSLDGFATMLTTSISYFTVIYSI